MPTLEEIDPVTSLPIDEDAPIIDEAEPDVTLN